MVTVSYAEGWDLSSATAMGPLSRSEAEARDLAGTPYALVYRLEGRKAPVEAQLVAWGDHYVGGWAYDDHGRRTREADWRLLEPERLFLRHLAEWRYDSPAQAEFARDVWRTRTELSPDSTGRTVSEPQGDLGSARHTPADVTAADRWRGRAGFGVRGGGSLLFSHPSLVDRDVTYQDASEAVPEPPPSAPAPWVPPRPAQPVHLRELFEPGTRLATRHQPEMTVGALRDIAALRVPSGRLAVTDPLTRGRTACRELSERIPPGVYPLQTAVVAYEGEYEDQRFPVEEEVAIRLLIDGEPPVSWELALADGDDARLLREGEFFGFDTDSAAGCFADASEWDLLAGKYRRFLVDGHDDEGESIGEAYIRTSHEASGTDLVSFYTSGDGTFPVWLGRSGSGELVSVVVVRDFLPDLVVL